MALGDDLLASDWGDFGSTDWTSFFGLDQQGLYYDTLTGQIVTADQAYAIDPGGFSLTAGDTTGGLGTGGFTLGGNTSLDTSLSGTGGGGIGDLFTYQNAIKSLSALGALGTLGVAGAGLFGGSSAPTTTQTSSTTANPLPAGAQGLIGTGTTGITGLGNVGTAAANQFLGQLSSSVPQLNPALQQALGIQAQGMAQGLVPALNDPAAQQQFDTMMAGQNAAIDYNTANSLQQALDLLRARGYAGGSEVFREGAPSAAMGQVVSAGNLAKAQAASNLANQRLQYATQLPQLASQLGGQQLTQQAIPYSSLISGLTTTAGLPLDVLKILSGQAGTTQTTSATGAAPTLLQQIGQIAPLIGAAGGLLGAAGGLTQNRTTSLFGTA